MKLLRNWAKTPTLFMPTSTYFDIHSANENNITIKPKWGVTRVPTDVFIEPPKGTYAWITSFKNNIHVIGGVINPDYRGNIIIGLNNQSDKPLTIHHNDRKAQVGLK